MRNMIVYLYDLKTKMRDYNRIKRNFYYHLNKTGLNKYYWKTKSVIAVPNSLEWMVDDFFKQYSDVSIVYKIKCSQIRKLE